MMKNVGNRLDVYLTEHGMVPSRERARALIMEGLVYVNEEKADKAGFSVPDGAKVEVRGSGLQYVSRGGLKLEKAFQEFPLDLKGKICMDIGASTGGFTDCMLQNGAAKVYCVDVGYGQLAWKLRCDERVVNMERTNVRYLTADQVPDLLDFFSVDVSFISLKHIFPVAASLTSPTAVGVCLVKPQFEAGREKVGKKGVVREAETHREVICKAIEYAKESGFCPAALSFSPIKGPEGNIEFLLYVTKTEQPQVTDQRIDEVVAQAHAVLAEGKK